MDAAERLIQGTQELLWERGYVGTSPRAIQRRAQAGQGSMYHHFAGKAELARAAIERSAASRQAQADAELSGPGPAIDRVAAYLRREREVLRGCPVGRLAQDPDVVADPALRQPLADTFAAIGGQLTAVLAEGQARGELRPGFEPAPVATALLATLQGSYVLARAAGSAAPFDQAVDGALTMLAALAA
jgi:TetR/AcrR family transcriptional regulator, transcriptional repressor for nem operon